MDDDLDPGRREPLPDETLTSFGNLRVGDHFRSVYWTGTQTPIEYLLEATTRTDHNDIEIRISRCVLGAPTVRTTAAADCDVFLLVDTLEDLYQAAVTQQGTL